MVGKDHRLVVAEGMGDALAFVRVEHDAREVVEAGMVLVERAGVLRDRLQHLPERRKGFAVQRVRVRSTDGVEPRGVYLRVDRESRRVHRHAPLDHRAVVRDQK